MSLSGPERSGEISLACRVGGWNPSEPVLARVGRWRLPVTGQGVPAPMGRLGSVMPPAAGGD